MPNASFQLNGKEVFSESNGVVTLKNTIVDNTNTILSPGASLGVSSDIYTFTANATVGITSLAFGPVVSMQMTNANAKVFIIYTIGYPYINNIQTYFRAVYKTTSFTAGQGNTSHGGTQITYPSGSFGIKYATGAVPVTFHLVGTLSNTAGETLYFSAEALTTSGTGTINQGGSTTSMTFTVMEVQN